MNFVTPSSFGTTLREANDCHNPAGSSEGGQFCAKDAGAAASTRSARSATHNGECQLCGSQQALPRGVLSKHGYTTRWGFFQGTCPGSGAKPYNTHTDRIASAIQASEEAAANSRAAAERIRAERATDTTAVAWVKTTRYIGRGRETVTSWQSVPVHEETFGDGRYKKFSVDAETFTGETRRRPVDFPYPGPQTRADAIDRMNEERAKAFEQEATQRDAYISWLKTRQSAWKEKPLVAREAPRQTPRNARGERTRTRVVKRDGKDVTQTLAYRSVRGRMQWVIADNGDSK